MRTPVTAAQLAMLTDRQNEIFAEVKKISPTLADWIVEQFVAGRTVREVWANLSTARNITTPIDDNLTPKKNKAHRNNGARTELKRGDAIIHANGKKFSFAYCPDDPATIATQELGEMPRIWSIEAFPSVTIITG